MAEGSLNGRRRFSDKWGKHELDVLAVLSSAFPQWLTSRQIAQRVKAYADSYGELADQAAKAAFAKQFQRDRAKLAAMGIAIESRQPEYSSKSEGQDFASYRLQLGDEPRVRMRFEQEDLPVLAAANYLAQSMSMSSALQQAQHEHQKLSRTAPRVPQMPVPGLGLDSIAPGLGTQTIPDDLIKEIDSRRFAATVDVDGEHINVAYSDSDDLAMFVLEHPGSKIISPQEAIDAFNRRLHCAIHFASADRPEHAFEEHQEITDSFNLPKDGEEAKGRKAISQSYQTGSEVDRRLRLMLFLSAHLGEEYPLTDLAERFYGHCETEDELKKAVTVIRKDIGTLTTVSDDGELAGSQFFDIDWPLLESEGIISATNSLGLERLAGIAPQYLSMLTASVSYLAHSPLLPEQSREQAQSLSQRLRAHTEPGETPWLSLTGYELEPPIYPIVNSAIRRKKLLDIEYTDGAGRTREQVVVPAKIFVDEGVYYAAIWDGLDDSQVQRTRKANKDKNRKHDDWRMLRLARIGKAAILEPEHDFEIPDVPLSEIRQWSFDNGTVTQFITDVPGHEFVQALTDAKVEPFEQGERVTLTVSSDSWFVAFCIAHARHIVAVSPGTLRTMIVARAKRELSVNGEEDSH